MNICAIDPGPLKSAFVITHGGAFQGGMLLPNSVLLTSLQDEAIQACALHIEMVACYGMPVGAETFETCRWIGRFEERFGKPATLVYRKDVKIHLCGSMKAKDGNIRQALIDKHGPVGTKKNPGPLYGVSGHLWAALAVADYAASQPQRPS